MHGLDLLFTAHGASSHVPAGEVVVRAGEPGGGLIRVREGDLTLGVPHGDRHIRVDTAGPGAVLGTVSVLIGCSATATATALSDAVIEVVDAELVRVALTEDPELAAWFASDVEQALGRDALLHALAQLLAADDAEIVATADQLAVRTVPAGTALCEQGAADATAFLVLGGRLGIRRDDEEVAQIGRGAMLGEVSLLTGAVRTATVIALRDTVVAELDEQGLRTIVAELPTVARAVFTRLAHAAAATGRGRDRTTTPAATIAVASASDRDNVRVLTTRFQSTLEPFGKVRLLTAAAVDRDLGIPGANDVAIGPIAHRLAAHLREQEATHAHVLFELPTELTTWSRRALGASDQVVVMVSANPDDAERARVQALVAATPDTTPVTVLVHHPAGAERAEGSAALRDALGADDILHVRDGNQADVARAARLTAGRGTALVLGGGGARGLAHLGVKRALDELGEPVDMFIGASIGSAMAGVLASDPQPDRVAATLEKLFVGVLDYTVPVTSLIKGETIAASIESFFDGREIEDLWIPFQCVSTNLTLSRTELHNRGPAALPVRASMGIPGVLPPVPRGEDLLIDGGVLDNLPVDIAAADRRCGTIIAVDVAPPTGPRASSDYGLSVSGWRALAATVRKGRSEFPGLTTILMRSVIVGSIAQRAQSLEEARVDLLLELHVRGLGLLDFDVKVEPVIEQGAELARPALEAWIATRPPHTR